MSANLELLALLVEHLLLTGLPAVAAALLASRGGVRSTPVLLGIALAASGATAIAGFWLFYASPMVGETSSFFFAFASIGAIVGCWRQGLDRTVLRQLSTPFALWALVSAFVVFLGFLHGGADEPLAMASIRFSHQLPSDNLMAGHFADYFYLHGHAGKPPPLNEWLSSDRPPLQIGYVLAQRPFGWDGSGLHYEILGVVVQQLWILGLWALLCAARLMPRTRGLVALAAIVSDVAIVHAFYIWPKLIAAAFLLGALALVLSPDWTRLRQRPATAALLAGLCSLAFLAHGSSFFFVLALLGLVAWHGLPSLTGIGVAVAVAVALLAPWSAYQHCADPPGNRLVKWQIGGSPEIDDRGTLETIADSYREVGVGGALERKWRNVTTLVGQQSSGEAVDRAFEEVSAARPGQAISVLRLPRFYNLLPFLGLLLLGPIAMAVAWLRRRPPAGPDWDFALLGLGFSACACLAWALLIFGGVEALTVMHQGSLAVPLLALCACAAGACAVDIHFGAGLIAANVALVLLLYVPVIGPIPGSSYSFGAALLAAAALAGIALLTLRPLRHSQVA
jgi:hypothetical protein